MEMEIKQLLESFGKIEKSIELNATEYGSAVKEMRELLDGVTTRVRKMEEAGAKEYKLFPSTDVSRREKLCRWMGDTFLEKTRGIKPQWTAFYEAELRALDQSVATSDQGGILVPVPLIPELLAIANTYGIARRLCRRIPMGQQTITLPISKNGECTVAWESEGTTASQTGVTFATLTLAAQKMLISSQLSSEIQMESVIPIMDYLIECLGRAAAKEEDVQFLLGDKSASPADPFDGVWTQVLSSTFPVGGSLRTGQDQSVACATGIDTLAEFVANANGLSYNAIMDTLYRVNPNLINNGSWVFHPQVEAALRKIKDADNLPVWNAGLSGVAPSTIFGRPYLTSLVAPNEATANGRLALYGDFNWWAMGTRENLEIAFNDNVGFLSDTRWVRMKQRVAFTCLDNQAFSGLTLAS